MVPKAEHFDALFSQETISLFVAGTLVGKSVPAAGRLHCEARDDTRKIEEVDAARVLAAELEVREATITKQTPQAFLAVG